MVVVFGSGPAVTSFASSGSLSQSDSVNKDLFQQVIFRCHHIGIKREPAGVSWCHCNVLKMCFTGQKI